MSTLFFTAGLLAPLVFGSLSIPQQDSLTTYTDNTSKLPRDSALTAEKYGRFLNSLDNVDLNSINIGLVHYNNLIDLTNLALADTLADLFMTFFFATIAFHNDRMWEDLAFMEKIHADDNKIDLALTPFYAAMDANGLQLYSFGRIYYIDQQPEFLLTAFRQSVTPPFQNYLALRADEIREGFSDHDSLIITVQAVADRVMKWERHLVNYPRAITYPRAHFYYMTYLSTLLTGLSGTPAFDDEGYLQPELVRLYDDIAKRNSDMLSGQIVKSFYESLVSGGFRWSPEVRQFYERHGIRNMHKVQVPIR